MNSLNANAKKELKNRKKTLSIQIDDDEVCKIEGKSLLEKTDSHKRNLSKDSNNQVLNSGSLILSETISNYSINTFRISKNSVATSIVRNGANVFFNSSREKTSNYIEEGEEITLESIKAEEHGESDTNEGNKILTENTFIKRSNSFESINKSYVSNLSVIALNKDIKCELANKSIVCTPNTICNYYLHSNEITPNKLCYNAASNVSNVTDGLHSVSATSSNQDLKAKISKINSHNKNSNNVNNVYSFNSLAFEDVVDDNFNFHFNLNNNNNHSARNHFEKRTPIKYTKSQFRSGEKDNTKGDESKRSSSNKNQSTSLTEMLKINSKPIDERLSLIAKEFKKNLNISELEIQKEEEKEDEKNTDSKKINYSDHTDIHFKKIVKDSDNNYNIKIFPDAKNLNFAFDQIKDLEETNSVCNEAHQTPGIHFNNLDNNPELTINILKNQNFSFDITHNKPATNVIFYQQKECNLNRAAIKGNAVISEEKQSDLKPVNISEIQINSSKEPDYSSINKSNHIKRIENYSFGSVNNTSLNNLTSLCSNLQQNRANLIEKISNNLRKYNLHPDLRSLFRKNKSHKQFENNMLEKNLENNEETKEDKCIVENNLENDQNTIGNSHKESERIDEKDFNINADNGIKSACSSKLKILGKLSPKYTTNEKRTESTLPSTGKSNQVNKRNYSLKNESCSKDLSEFEIKNSIPKIKSGKEEVPNRLGLNIKEIVIRAKDNKTSLNSYFSPGERKKHSTSPRYNQKTTQSKGVKASNALIHPGKNPKLFELIKLYSVRGQGAFVNKGISPVNNKCNSYTKSGSKSKLNGASFVSNNNSYARSTSRNDSKNRTIEATYQADHSSGNQSNIKIIKSSEKKNDTKNFKFKEIIDSETLDKNSSHIKLVDSSNKKYHNKLNNNQNVNQVLPPYTKERNLGIIKDMKNKSKHSQVDNKQLAERIYTNKDGKVETHSYTEVNSMLTNKIKLNEQIKNVQIKSIPIEEKENIKDFNNIKQESTRNNIINKNENSSLGRITSGGCINYENLNIAKCITNRDDSKIGNIKDSAHNINFPLQVKKNIQVISNFSNYTKKKTSDVISAKSAVSAKPSNEINNLVMSKHSQVSNLILKINYISDNKSTKQSGKISLCDNRSRLVKEKINNMINKQIVSSKIKYLSGDDDFVFFDE